MGSKYVKFIHLDIMKELIDKLDGASAKNILNEIMGVYFDKGFGVMNKTEIETLIYFALKKHGLLTGKCFDDGQTLQITEARARKLIYESQVKYEKRDKNALDAYLRKYIGDCLVHAVLVKNNKEISFAIEDKYIRIALNAKLRENHYFADTSFNKDIISLNEATFQRMVAILVPNYQREVVLENLNAIVIEENDSMNEYVSSFIKEAMIQGSIEAVKQIGKLIIASALQ